MLTTLRVQNFGAVDDATIELDEGLTVLTGETGAGKTLLVEALHLVVGGADRGLPVLDATSPSRVEAVFVDALGDEVLLSRERSVSGRLRATLDGELASAKVLAERAVGLCELHGQHEHQVLRASGAARALLDRSASIDDGEVRELRARRRALVAARDRLGGSAAERARRLELVEHERAEIDAAAPRSESELDELLEEVTELTSVLESKESLARAVDVLEADGDAPSAAGLLSTALTLVPNEMLEEHTQLVATLDEVRALATTLRRRLERLEDDPARLDQLNERVATLQALVRKHGHALADVLARCDALEAELVLLRADEQLAGDVEDQLEGVEGALGAAEHAVAKLRAEAGASLERSVAERLPSLAMPHARFAVGVTGPAGEDVRFAFAGSAAFEPAPLADAASGGELSRVMLGLTLATHAGAGCLVFDEVDAGVGGATAKALGACLAELARDTQVVVVTHLATVAARATRHLVVTRGAAAGSPATIVRVEGEARIAEVARMLAGDAADPVAREHAAALLAGDPAAS